MTRDRKNRILIIDDTQDIHDDIKKILQPPESTDFNSLVQDITGESAPECNLPEVQIDSALQGEKGVAMVRQAKLEGKPYALVYVDIRIPPGLDGIETIKQLQQEDEHLQYVIISAYSDYSWQDISEAISSGDNLLVLKKPFESIEIRQSASALIEKYHLAREHREAMAALARANESQRLLNLELQDRNDRLALALGKVRLLSGMLPICSNCQKIRDDKNYWHEVTDYISEHSSTEFTHSICPDCSVKLYPELFEDEED